MVLKWIAIEMIVQKEKKGEELWNRKSFVKVL